MCGKVLKERARCLAAVDAVRTDLAHWDLVTRDLEAGLSLRPRVIWRAMRYLITSGVQPDTFGNHLMGKFPEGDDE